MPEPETSRARNVLILCSDEHNHRCLGSLGHPVVQTPHLDRLAARGTTFSRAWTPSPICVPTRASLATGRWVHELGTWDSAQPYTGETPGWAHLVRDAGGHAVSIGKLHFRSSSDDYGFTESLLPMHVVNEVGWVQGLPRQDPLPYPEAAEMAREVGVGHTSYTRYDERVTDRAVEWLRDNADGSRPWALFVSLVAPHYPLSAPEEFSEPYRGVDLGPEIGPMSITHPAVQAMADFFAYHEHFDPQRVLDARRAYLSLCTWMDHNVGRVLDALDHTGATDDTLVIYTSDHGEMAGNRGLWGKSYMYEDSVRVPMIVAGPGVPRGVVSETPANLVDVAPTVVDALAPTAAGDGPGTSLVDLVQAADPQRLLFSEYHDGGSTTGSFAVQVGEWKYVHHVGFEPELYDLAADPDELVDLGVSPDHAQIRADCREALHSVVDPEVADRQAFTSQQRLLDALGGRNGLAEHVRFNHTPIPDH